MGGIVEIIVVICCGLYEVFSYSIEMICLRWKNAFEAPILKGIRMKQNNTFIINLIRKGYDVNTSNELGKTPLHIAVSRPSMVNVVHELIKSGANINARDRSNRTPLRHAVQYDNLEAVCVLLYYDADVNIVCEQFMTPFIYALYACRLDIARILRDYYDNYSSEKCCHITSLHLAVARDSALATSLLNKGADVNSVTSRGHSLLEFALHYDTAMLFKFIWYKIDHRVLLKRSGSYLLHYINECEFSISDWLDCMHLLLESPVAVDLVQSCNDWIDREQIWKPTLFQQLAYSFNAKEIEFKDRISLIYTCLNLGAQVNIYDAIEMYINYGFNEEFEALIDVTIASNCNGELFPIDTYNVSMPVFILAVEANFSGEDVFKHFINQIETNLALSTILRAQKCMTSLLGYFAISSNLKGKLINLNETHTFMQEFWEKFQEMQSRIPEIPSLVELSRKQAREFIKQACKVKKPCQFHNAVRNLKVPQIIKDVIRFKTPIYY